MGVFVFLFFFFFWVVIVVFVCGGVRTTTTTTTTTAAEGNDGHRRQRRRRRRIVVYSPTAESIVVGDGGVTGGGGSGSSGSHRQQHIIAISKKHKHDIMNLNNIVLNNNVDNNNQNNNNQQHDDDDVYFEYISLNTFEQRDYIMKHIDVCGGRSDGSGGGDSSSSSILKRFDELQQHHHATTTTRHLSIEIWKYCAFLVVTSTTRTKDNHDNDTTSSSSSSSSEEDYYDGMLYIDPESPHLGSVSQMHSLLMSSSSTYHSNQNNKNIAVLGDSTLFPNTIHGSLLYMTNNNNKKGGGGGGISSNPEQYNTDNTNNNNILVAQKMLHLILSTPLHVLDIQPLLIPQHLYQLIITTTTTTTTTTTGDVIQQQQRQPQQDDNDNEEWLLLSMTCRMGPMMRRNMSQDISSSSSTTTTTAAAAAVDGGSIAHVCPSHSGYCCTVTDPNRRVPILVSRFPLLPYQVLPAALMTMTTTTTTTTTNKDNNPSTTSSRRPYNAEAGHYSHDELPYISTISEKLSLEEMERRQQQQGQQQQQRNNHEIVPNFYDYLSIRNCLPSDDICTHCLREKTGANCNTCASVCTCYCKALCRDDAMPQSKHISKIWTVTPPFYYHDPNRLIPRIIHQTWYEPISTSPMKYPAMSRMVESFRKSGWEYKFYTDDDAANFISTHFPNEVREAYDALIPGAFKADLFRYCVLLIYGGLYADVDVHLESYIDDSIPNDVSFMVPMDEPGKPIKKQMCLWNGLIASMPSHPFLVKAIETIVNQVRNRYTSVDIDATFCNHNKNKNKNSKNKNDDHDDHDHDDHSHPELSIMHAYDTLYTAGPCMLGASINRVLGRDAQTPFQPGILMIDGRIEQQKQEEQGQEQQEQEQQLDLENGTSFIFANNNDNNDNVVTSSSSSSNAKNAKEKLPGRIIILKQNKWDMGAHRFTNVDTNVVIAATDFPKDTTTETTTSTTDTTTTTTTAGGGGGGDGTTTTNNDGHEHYSKAHAKTGIYGVEGLYTNQERSNEEIRIHIDITKSRHVLTTTTVVSSAL